MFNKRVKRVPVVDENNNLIELVMQKEILKTLLEYMKK